MDAQQIAQLDDEHFEKLVTTHLHPRHCDPAVWQLLISPTLVTRTCDTLAAMHRNVSGALRSRKAARAEFQQECFKRGAAGKQDWFDTMHEFENWKRRAGNFSALVQERLSEARKAQKDVNRGMNHQIAGQHRDVIRELALAIRSHQASHAKSGTRAEQCDHELWRLLDRLTVPLGPDQEPATLRTMLDYYWTDVEPVDASQEKVAWLEGVMRSAPAGRSAQFGGMPQARHVGNDKKLA